MSKPVNKFRLKGVEIVQWDNDGKPSFTVSKSYKDKSGEWKNTTSLYLEDLANLSAVATLALVANYSNKPAQAEPTQHPGIYATGYCDKPTQSQHEQEKANAYQKDPIQDEIPF